MEITWSCKSFSELSPHELYAVLRLRNEVFAVEQNCVYLDCDNKDQGSYHLCGWQDNSLVAYARLMPPGLVYAEPSIGRVITSATVRKQGIGKELMKIAIKKANKLFKTSSITISAQLYLKHFYESLGFAQCSDIYIEDHIDHIKMQY